MWVNRADAWGTGSKFLHWLFVVLIAFEVPAGYLMSRTYGPALRDPGMAPLHDLLSQIHHTTGFVVLGLLALRLWLRLQYPTPPLPADMSGGSKALARLIQGALYALLIIIPLSGWAAVTSLADSAALGPTHLWFFGMDGLMPKLPFVEPKPFEDPDGYRLFGPLHVYFLYAGAALLTLHIIGALWHHLVRRDHVLLKIWPGAKV